MTQNSWLVSADAELSAEWAAWIADHDRLVEAQALEQAAEIAGEAMPVGSPRMVMHQIQTMIRARAVEIREGRQ